MSSVSEAVLCVVFALVLLVVDSSRRTRGRSIDSWDFLEPYVVGTLLVSMLTWLVLSALVSEGTDFVHGTLRKLLSGWM